MRKQSIPGRLSPPTRLGYGASSPPVDKWLTWCLDTNIVVRIDADVIPLEREGILAAVNSLQLMVVLEVGPAPQAAVNHMRKPLAMRNLMRGEKGKKSL